MAIDILTFGRLFKEDTSIYKRSVKTYFPNPEINSYNKGYIIRYFLQKSNDSDSYVYEVEQTLFDEFSNNPFYKCVTLTWRLTGSVDEVIESNRISLQIACEQLPALKLYLPNFLQFHKEYLEK
jgi:hypothetical protein